MDIDKLINILTQHKKEGFKEVYLTDVNINKIKDLERFNSFDVNYVLGGCGNFIVLFCDEVVVE